MTRARLRSFDPARDLAALHDLWHEYLVWGNEQLALHHGVQLGEAQATVAADLAHLDSFEAPQGCLLLAETPAGLMGSVALRKSADGVAEIKRLYVRPTARGLGLGRALVETALQHARAAGYSAVRLDSARFMSAAHALYRQQGFTDIPPYAQSEVPSPYWAHWVFMQLSLAPRHPESSPSP